MVPVQSVAIVVLVAALCTTVMYSGRHGASPSRIEQQSALDSWNDLDDGESPTSLTAAPGIGSAGGSVGSSSALRSSVYAAGGPSWADGIDPALLKSVRRSTAMHRRLLNRDTQRASQLFPQHTATAATTAATGDYPSAPPVPPAPVQYNEHHGYRHVPGQHRTVEIPPMNATGQIPPAPRLGGVALPARSSSRQHAVDLSEYPPMPTSPTMAAAAATHGERHAGYGFIQPSSSPSPPSHHHHQQQQQQQYLQQPQYQQHQQHQQRPSSMASTLSNASTRSGGADVEDADVIAASQAKQLTLVADNSKSRRSLRTATSRTDPRRLSAQQQQQQALPSIHDVEATTTTASIIPQAPPPPPYPIPRSITRETMGGTLSAVPPRLIVEVPSSPLLYETAEDRLQRRRSVMMGKDDSRQRMSLYAQRRSMAVPDHMMPTVSNHLGSISESITSGKSSGDSTADTVNSSSAGSVESSGSQLTKSATIDDVDNKQRPPVSFGSTTLIEGEVSINNLYLKLGKQTKRTPFEGQLSIPTLSMLFMDKFNTTAAGIGIDDDSFPTLYIRHPTMDIYYELEDLSEVCEDSVLMLNVDESKLDSSSKDANGKQHQHEILSAVETLANEMKELRSITTGIRDRQDEFDKSMGKLQSKAAASMAALSASVASATAAANTAASAASAATADISRPQSPRPETPSTAAAVVAAGNRTSSRLSGSFGSVTPSPAIAPQQPSQQSSELVEKLQKDLAAARKELAVANQQLQNQKTASTAEINALKSERDQLRETVSANPAAQRVTMEAGITKLTKRTDEFTTRMDDYQLALQEIRKDIAQRGARPADTLLSYSLKESRAIVDEISAELDSLAQSRPAWRKTWEEELQVVLAEQQAIKEKQQMLEMLKEDGEALNELFGKLQNAITNLQRRPRTTNLAVARLREGLLTAGDDASSEGGSTTGSLGYDDNPVDTRQNLLKEIAYTDVNHERRLQAIEDLEKIRRREKEGRVDDFTKELNDFVESGALKSQGGVERVEQLREEKNKELLRQMLIQQHQQKLAASSPSPVPPVSASPSRTRTPPVAADGDEAAPSPGPGPSTAAKAKVIKVVRKSALSSSGAASGDGSEPKIIRVKRKSAAATGAGAAVPWEALIPGVLITGMLGVGGIGMRVVSLYENDWKTPRVRIDEWDEMMMERDERLTGKFRAQSDEPVAPKEFSTNSAWKVYRHANN
ncbi:AIP3-domain-containing protein [Ramicandelaber brevisporus]|nr:AIP3-domain-containing protein [Ramicandelaber brevisporus]